MEKKELIIKWLNGNLTEEERGKFNDLPESKDYREMAHYAQFFKSEEFETEESYRLLLEKRKKMEAQKRRKWIWRVAAILILAIGIGYGVFYNNGTPTLIVAQRAEIEQVDLPNQSQVRLNSGSRITYDRNDWSKNRLVHLQGEAFFKVTEGQRFEVATDLGSVVVKGTRFNVFQRGQHFSITCYEGRVAVITQEHKVMLNAGEMWNIVRPETKKKINGKKPDWLRGRSKFNSIPVARVFHALERQYNIEIQVEKRIFDTQQRFTGSFVHDNLKQALKSVLLPFGWSYERSGNTVSIVKSEP